MLEVSVTRQTLRFREPAGYRVWRAPERELFLLELTGPTA